jgi:hypothetical protein
MSFGQLSTTFAEERINQRHHKVLLTLERRIESPPIDPKAKKNLIGTPIIRTARKQQKTRNRCPF